MGKCPNCNGHPKSENGGQCDVCEGTGMVSRFKWVDDRKAEDPDTVKIDQLCIANDGRELGRLGVYQDNDGDTEIIVSAFGWFFHTIFCNDIEHAKSQIDGLKVELEKIYDLIPVGGPLTEENETPAVEEIAAFVDRH